MAGSDQSRSAKKAQKELASVLEPNETVQEAVIGYSVAGKGSGVGSPLVGTAMRISGKMQTRLVAVTDRSLYFAELTTWTSKFRSLIGKYAVGEVPVTSERNKMTVGDQEISGASQAGWSKRAEAITAANAR